MTSGEGSHGPHSPWPKRLGRWVTLDHLCGVAVIAFVVLAFGLLYAAFVTHEYVLDWTVVTSLGHLKPAVAPSAVDIANLEAGAKAFEAERAKLLSSDAISFLVVLMSVIVGAVAVMVFSGSEKKLKRAEERIDQANKVSRRLASFIGATSAGQSASILAGMIDRNLGRLADELTVSTAPGQGDAVVGVLGDWLRCLRDTLTDPDFVEIGIPRPTFNALCDAIALIDAQFRNIDLAIERDRDEKRTEIDDLVRGWLASSKAPEPHDLEEGTLRLREIARLKQKLRVEGCIDENTLASKIKTRLLQHERDHYATLMPLIDKFYELDIHLHRVQTHQTHLHQLQQTIDQCRKALREDLCRNWEEFNAGLKGA